MHRHTPVATPTSRPNDNHRAWPKHGLPEQWRMPGVAQGWKEFHSRAGTAEQATYAQVRGRTQGIAQWAHSPLEKVKRAAAEDRAGRVESTDWRASYMTNKKLLPHSPHWELGVGESSQKFIQTPKELTSRKRKNLNPKGSKTTMISLSLGHFYKTVNFSNQSCRERKESPTFRVIILRKLLFYLSS